MPGAPSRESVQFERHEGTKARRHEGATGAGGTGIQKKSPLADARGSC